jgi:hypothetical protein
VPAETIQAGDHLAHVIAHGHTDQTKTLLRILIAVLRINKQPVKSGPLIASAACGFASR